MGSRDKVTRNMTLYPRFGLATDPYAEFMINFVAAREVEPDYQCTVCEDTIDGLMPLIISNVGVVENHALVKECSKLEEDDTYHIKVSDYSDETVGDILDGLFLYYGNPDQSWTYYVVHCDKSITDEDKLIRNVS